jgi:hypothetical protein
MRFWVEHCVLIWLLYCVLQAVRERRAASKASQLHVSFSDAFKLLVMSLSDCVRALHAQRHDAVLFLNCSFIVPQLFFNCF